jgi:hypothetical protein
MHRATTPPAPATRRFDAGRVRVSERDIAGLMLCGEMYGAPYDLLACPHTAMGRHQVVIGASGSGRTNLMMRTWAG